MNNGARGVYEYHNVNRRGDGFSILKAERSELFARAIGTGKKILDLGCRDGALTKSFVEGNDVTGADIDSVALAKAQAALGIKTLGVDLNADWSELGQEKYDVVVLAETLEHVYHPEKIVEKVTKHLNEDGMFVGSVPNGFSLKNRIRLFFGRKRYTTLMDPTHINHFTHYELKGLLQKHFQEVSVVPLGRWAWLDRVWPGMFSFDLAWVCRGVKK